MENLREIAAVADERKFRKAILGFNKKEVEDYIETLVHGSRASISNYEKKLGEQSVSLGMALREKETLEEKIRELEKRVTELKGGDEEKSRLLAQNNALKEENAQITELRGRNEILALEAAGLAAELRTAREEQKKLALTVEEKDAVILEQCKTNADNENILRTESEKQKILQESERKIRLCGINKIKEQLKTALETLETL